MKSSTLLAAALLPALAAAAAAADHPVQGVDRAYIDPAASPCKDFYDYANGAFNRVPIPGEYSNWGVNQEIDERNYAILRDILETSARTGGPRGTAAQRVGDFFGAGMDEAAIERDGLKALAPFLAEIEAIKTRADLMPTLGHLLVEGVDGGFNFGIQIDDKDTTAMIASFYQGWDPLESTCRHASLSIL